MQNAKCKMRDRLGSGARPGAWNSVVPTGLGYSATLIPALKCWAILGRASGTAGVVACVIPALKRAPFRAAAILGRASGTAGGCRLRDPSTEAGALQGSGYSLPCLRHCRGCRLRDPSTGGTWQIDMEWMVVVAPTSPGRAVAKSRRRCSKGRPRGHPREPLETEGKSYRALEGRHWLSGTPTFQFLCRPCGAWLIICLSIPGLTPWAILCRPYGAIGSCSVLSPVILRFSFCTFHFVLPERGRSIPWSPGLPRLPGRP